MAHLTVPPGPTSMATRTSIDVEEQGRKRRAHTVTVDCSNHFHRDVHTHINDILGTLNKGLGELRNPFEETFEETRPHTNIHTHTYGYSEYVVV